MGRRQSMWAVITAVVFAVTALGASDADARRKRRRKKPAAAQKVNAQALAELMGAFKFGMSRDDVIEVVSKQIVERYAEKIAATSDVYQQDALRKEQKQKIKEFTKSSVEFKGKRTGWDVSLIDDQFAHKTGESMLVLWETHEGRNQRRFFFFHEGKLFRMFIQLDTSALQDNQRNFDFFKQLMVQRFGPAKEAPDGLLWETKALTVAALDKLRFYSALCLVVTDNKLFRQVLATREANKSGPRKRNSIIEAVTAGDGAEGPGLDEGANTIDNILKDL